MIKLTKKQKLEMVDQALSYIKRYEKYSCHAIKRASNNLLLKQYQQFLASDYPMFFILDKYNKLTYTSHLDIDSVERDIFKPWESNEDIRTIFLKQFKKSLK